MHPATIEQAILYALIALLVMLAFNSYPSVWTRLTSHDADEPKRATGRLLASIVLIHGLLVVGTVAIGPWHGNDHGTERLAHLTTYTATDDFWNGVGFHGHGWIVLYRILELFSLTPYTPNHLLSMGAVVAIFAWTRGMGGSSTAALLAAAILALHPMQLRMAGTLSLYLGAQLGLLAALAMAAWWNKQPWFWSKFDSELAYPEKLFILICLLLLAMHQHLELMLLAPAVVSLMIMCKSTRERGIGRFFDQVFRSFFLSIVPRGQPNPAAFGLITLAIVLLTMRLSGLANFEQRMGLNVFDWGPKRPALLFLAAIPLVAATARDVHQLVVARLPRSFTVAVTVCCLAAGVYEATSYTPTVLFADGNLPRDQVLPFLHGYFWTQTSPTSWVALAGLGALALAVRNVSALLGLTCSLVLMTLVYGGVWDNPTTYFRAGLVALPILIVFSAFGLEILHEQLATSFGRPWVASTICAVVLAVTSASRHMAWTHAYPDQQDASLVAHAKTLESGAVVHMLMPEDAEPLHADAHIPFGYREALYTYLYGRLGHLEHASLKVLLDLPPAEQEGHYVLLSSACARADFIRIEQQPTDQRPVYAGGRVWDATATTEGYGTRTVRQRVGPCLVDPSLARCTSDETPCPEWQCPSDAAVSPAEAPPIQDPRCREVRDRLILQPIFAERVAEGTLSEPSRILDPDMEVGLYLVTGTR